MFTDMERRPSARERLHDSDLLKHEKTLTSGKYDSSFHNGVSLRSASRSTKSTSDKLLDGPELEFRLDKQRTSRGQISPPNLHIRSESAKSRLLTDEHLAMSDGPMDDENQLKMQLKKKKKRKNYVTANLSGTRYEIGIFFIHIAL